MLVEGNYCHDVLTVKHSLTIDVSVTMVMTTFCFNVLHHIYLRAGTRLVGSTHELPLISIWMIILVNIPSVKSAACLFVFLRLGLVY